MEGVAVPDDLMMGVVAPDEVGVAVPDEENLLELLVSVSVGNNILFSFFVSSIRDSFAATGLSWTSSNGRFLLLASSAFTSSVVALPFNLIGEVPLDSSIRFECSLFNRG